MNTRNNVLGWLLSLLMLLAFAPLARGQYAPAGNEHPESKSVDEQGKGQAPPFGVYQPANPALLDPVARHQFAAQVNLEPLRSLAVFHNGRVKVLDTLARETVRKLSGRRDYTEPVKKIDAAAGEALVRTESYDAMFTLLDLAIDPMAYTERPLLHINYLPLRRAVLEAAFPLRESAGNANVQERWMRLQRVTPAMVERYVPEIADAHGTESGYREALGRLQDQLGIWSQTGANFLLIAPARPDQPWQHISSLAADHPARVAALELGAAWRAGDAAKVNAAASKLALELPKINADVYPTAKRELEITYNKVNAFEWGAWAYLLTFLTLLLGFGTGRRWLGTVGIVLLIASILLHGFGFVARCFIAERFAIQNQFESMTGISLFAAIVGLVMTLTGRKLLFGAAAAGVGFMILIAATQTGIPGVNIEREAAILNTSVLLKYHVTTVLVSYGLIALGFLISLLYLAAHYIARAQNQDRNQDRSAPRPAQNNGPSGGGGGAIPALAGGVADAELLRVASTALGAAEAVRAESASPFATTTSRSALLRDLDTAQMTVLQLAFWTLGVGILLGAWWADHSWGRWWAFDPKETWALITWIVYLIVIHVRMAGLKDKGLTTAWLSVIGFIVMLWTYFGVNLLLPGLHAYA
ncbi:MAG: cytochrome c biogenesis protein CcsA [Planctomycetota bacterium]|nr:cytochrome c biogenesis protein CcsA [Planctomycetota bacterium]